MQNLILQQATKLVEMMQTAVEASFDRNMPKEIADIVKYHSAAASTAAVAAAWIPGAGSAAALVLCTGFIWSMYARIGAKIGLPFRSNVLKSLASGMATNVAGYVVGFVTMSTALSFVPGLGSAGASAIMGSVTYAIGLGSGFLYLKLMTKLFSQGIDPTTLSAEELKEMAKSVAKESNLKKVLKQARGEFKSQVSGEELHGSSRDIVPNDSSLESSSPIAVRVVNAEHVYASVNQSDTLSWPSDDIRRKAGTNAWHDWYPKDGMIGRVIHESWHPGNKEIVYIVELEGHFAPIGQSGVEHI